VKKKITGWLPVYASAKFEVEFDTDGMSEAEIADKFRDEAEPVGRLCHQCSDEIETDFTVDWDAANEDIDFDSLEIEDAD
jgi:hypothetical protein